MADAMTAHEPPTLEGRTMQELGRQLRAERERRERAEAERDALRVDAHGLALVEAVIGQRGMVDHSTPVHVRVQNVLAEADHAAAVQGEIARLNAELAALRGIVPEFPPRPPNGEGVPRYGIRWNGPESPLAVPMTDGYWTPWHLADAALSAERSLRAHQSDAANVTAGAVFRCDDGRLVRVSGMPDGVTVCRDSRGRVAVRNVATNRLSYLPEGMLKSMPRIDAALRRAGEGA